MTTTTVPVQRMQELVRPVRDLTRSRAFYCQALGLTEAAEPVLAGDDYRLLADAWGAVPQHFLRLSFGRQTLLLAACEQPPQPPDAGADDPRFQHIALRTADIDAAWRRLLAHGPVDAIGQGGPQRLPAASGGVTAVKFRDPDGHPLELLVPTGTGIVAGIDHSAITVSDADASIAFYAERLGLRLQARQVNRGAEQARLDGLAAPVVEVVALLPAAGSPHLELLGYRPARPAAAAAAAGAGIGTGPRSTTVWRRVAGSAPALVTDPDGHPHLLLPSSFSSAPPDTP